MNWPIFFCRNPIQGPDVIRSQARNPKNFLLDYDATFELLANTPEGNHAGLMFSGHGTPDGWINEHGYVCHTFMWVNKVCGSAANDFSQLVSLNGKHWLIFPGWYTPNSFAHKFSPDDAEAPYKVSDNIVSHKSHYYHEGKLSEHDQPRELYKRVMNDQARANLHSNTAKMLSKVNYAIISKRYLAQIYCIAPEYARGVYDLTKFKHEPFGFEEVEEESKNAPTMRRRSRSLGLVRVIG